MVSRPKRFLTLLILAILSLFSPLTQELRADTIQHHPYGFGLSGGVVASQVDGDGYWGYTRLNATASVFVTYTLTSKWMLRLDFQYAGKGSYNAGKSGGHRNLNYSLSLHYLELPLRGEYSFSKYIQLSAGIAPALLIVSSERNRFGEVIQKGKLRVNRFALSALAAVHWRFNRRFSVRGEVGYSILPIRGRFGAINSPTRRGQYNSTLSFSLEYTF